MLHEALKKWFGFESFKKGQEEIISNVLNHKHTLGILPTGSGKSLCYQLPTYINKKPTLVVSPLISLMDDQVMQMKINGETSVSCVHSGMDEQERQYNLAKIKSSRFIFLSPEFLLQPFNAKLLTKLDLGLIVLDEAHCLSEWGYDFRPHYALIGKITRQFPQATILALTATAQPYLLNDINHMLNANLTEIKTTMNRDNISLSHLNFDSDETKLTWLLDFIKNSGPTIIYVSSKKICLSLAQAIYDEGYLTGIYHGDLSYQERHTVQHQFISNEIPIIVATSAFGMGINKKDIRTIIHFHIPTSPSSYMQEIGRAGRDGEISQAISLYQPDDSYLLETLLFTDSVTSDDIALFETGDLIDPIKLEMLETLSSYYSIHELTTIFNKSLQRKQLAYKKMINYKMLDTCRRSFLLAYFGEYNIKKPSYCCDNDTHLKKLTIYNKKKVKRKMDYNEKLQNLFN
ncbi:RecQ family ATP-dependent DNA helicase [Staphylococcus durrellii]|uniref:RecQ family ATP-dependent DNA helicase n=1 Tax=Staphylococcus durrellii TaxID=2781773 RepID=UPI00189D8477|nr:ATP-dependent DNA helicase RecQ [Staphylococcus durrellii]MBF7017072.1 ATP-dependent DNA helicase RecQ [Staphylococcus durrellii]